MGLYGLNRFIIPPQTTHDEYQSFAFLITENIPRKAKAITRLALPPATFFLFK